jgi:uncharacterized membrane protein
MQNSLDFNRGAIRPIQCLSDGYVMLKGNYGSFLGVLIVGGLIILVSACIPLSPLLPPVMCGIYLCLFAIMRGEKFNTNTLFKGFNFFGQSFLASLVFSVPMFILSIIMQFGIGGLNVLVENLELEKNPPVEEVLPVLYGFFGFIFGMVLLILVVSMILGILMAFVYPLIVDRKLSAIQALKLSVRAVFGNFFGVIGLTILGYLIILAGWMFFYVGVLFVAPYIIAAWSVAYSRVFNIQILQQVGQMNAPQQSVWSPPISNSKAGWVLTLCATLIVGLSVTLIATFGFYAYQGINEAIEKKANEERRKKNDMPTVTYPSPATSIEIIFSNQANK